MHPTRLLLRLVVGCLLEVHAKRRKAVLAGVDAILTANSLVAADLGRAIATETSPKHGIKRVDRLLGNPRLHGELGLFYKQTAKVLLGPRPLLLVDWTVLCRGHHALSAAVVHDGRAIPIYNEVHPSKLQNSPEVEAAFLDELRGVVPAGSTPIVVTDAGFQTGWFLQLQDFGWDFVGRLRCGRLNVREAGVSETSAWHDISKLLEPLQNGDIIDFGSREISKASPVAARLVGVHHKPAKRCGRPKRRVLRHGKKTEDKYRRRAQRSALFTSLEKTDAARIEVLYAARMQIEETFRSAKSHRFGWSLQDAYSRSAKRLEVLLLLATLAMLGQVLVGVVAEHRKFHHQFQANTTRHRRVISLFALGAMVLRQPRWRGEITLSWLEFGLTKLRQHSAEYTLPAALAPE